MAQTPICCIRVEIAKCSRGNVENVGVVNQVVGGGVTNILTIEQPLTNNLELSASQVTGFLGYIGLLNAGIDTAAIETAIATLVAAS